MKKKERKFHGRTYGEMNEIFNTLCDIEDHYVMTPKESDAFDIALDCVAAIMNRMDNDRPITWG